MDVIYRQGESSVSDVLGQLTDPPSYSAVRTMLRLLEEKGFLKHRRDDKRYLYRLAESRNKARRNALNHLLHTFFGGSASDAVAAMLEISSDELDDRELNRLAGLIENALKNER